VGPLHMSKIPQWSFTFRKKTSLGCCQYFKGSSLKLYTYILFCGNVTFVTKYCFRIKTKSSTNPSSRQRLERPCYLSRVDHNRKIRSRKQKTDIGKYSFVNRTIQFWNHLPADVLGSLSCKPSNFRKRVRKVINKAI
jgi:hypothetical protein